MTVADLLRRSAERQADKPALIEPPGRTVTYGRLNDRVRALAAGLLDLGVGRGDRIALLTRNRIEWVEVFFAAALCGAVVVPFNPRLSDPEIGTLLMDASPAVLVADDLARLRALGGAADLKQVLIGPEGPATPYESLFRPDLAPPHVPGAAATEPQAILYTSGTTAGPKGVVLTHLNVVAGNFLLQATEFDLGRDDVFLVSTPLCHRVGATRVVTAAGLGATCVILPKFEPDAMAAAILDHGVTVVGTVPTVIRLLAAALAGQEFPTVRAVLLTGERITAATRSLAGGLFPRAAIHGFYACTEAGVVTLGSPDDLRPESCGRPALGVELRIEGAGPGGAGEILVRSDAPGLLTVAAGYWREGRIEPFEGGWYRSGDVGRIEPDGTLSVLDRRKDVIISGGFNVYCPDVEAALRAFPGVSDASVAGVPDPVWGECVCGFIVPGPASRIDVAAIQAFCRGRLPGYAVPRRLFVLAQLPRNALGKVIKTELRRLAAEAG